MSAVIEPEATPPALSFHELPVNNSTEAIIENVRVNYARGLPELKIQEAVETPLIVVGGGPSLHDYMPALRSLRDECHVLSVNGAYKFLRSQGVESEYFVLIDSRRDNLVHVDSPHEDTNHLLASQVHPAVFDALGGYQVTLFNLGTEACVEALNGFPDPKSFLAAPIGMASIHAIYIAAALGYRKIFLFGYDFSHKAGETYAFEQRMNKDDKPFTVTMNGKRFQTTLALARTAEQFQRSISPIIEKLGLDVRLMSSGLLPEIIRAQQSPTTEASEREKYEQIWGVDLYRKVSPGLEDVDQAAAILLMEPPASVADFGCGTGRCVKRFMELGFNAIGVDIATNCLEESVPFVHAALWDAEKLPKVDYGFSCDVLEHIPSERLRETLRAIHDSARIGCYLNIDTIPDSFGVWIGKTLHLSVLSAERWQELLEEVWPNVTKIRDDGRQAVFICKR